MRYPSQLFAVHGTKDNPVTPAALQSQKIAIASYLASNGTGVHPDPPRDLIAQTAPNGILITWGLPQNGGSDIDGWTVYYPNDVIKAASIPGRGTRQYLLVASSGSVQAWVASVNPQGLESAKVLITGTAGTSTATVPSTPPGFSSGTGSDTSNFGLEIPPLLTR